MSFKTVSAILRGAWLLDKAYAESLLPLVVSVFKGEGTFASLFIEGDQEESKMPRQLIGANAVYRIGYYTDMTGLPEGSIAMIDINGPIMKYGGACSFGSIDKGQTIQRAANAPNIKGILLNIDSPGGQVAGTTDLADIVKSISKPVVAMINDGIAASAAMWIASAADEIYVTKKTDQVGSIGVYTTLYDFSGRLEQMGVKVHEIYAPGSEEKNLDYKEALKGNYDLIKEDLKVIRDEFINTVSRNRGDRLKGDKWKGGKMFYGEEATRIGLIDGTMPLNKIVARINFLSKNKK
jgi:protease IV